MAYVKGQGYVKTGYTPCQKEIAEWINLGHTHMRDDPILQDYACNGQGHHWWPFVKSFQTNGGFDGGDGSVTLFGSGVPGKDFVTSNGKIIHGKVKDATFKSGNLTIHVKGWGMSGAQVLHGFLGG